MAENKLIKKISVMSFALLISRIMGLVRDRLWLSVLGLPI
jgi:peptidoglycan biosynthesis protein MviN/MurJ (putative lipid II flippase)